MLASDLFERHASYIQTITEASLDDIRKALRETKSLDATIAQLSAPARTAPAPVAPVTTIDLLSDDDSSPEPPPPEPGPKSGLGSKPVIKVLDLADQSDDDLPLPIPPSRSGPAATNGNTLAQPSASAVAARAEEITARRSDPIERSSPDKRPSSLPGNSRARLGVDVIDVDDDDDDCDDDGRVSGPMPKKRSYLEMIAEEDKGSPTEDESDDDLFFHRKKPAPVDTGQQKAKEGERRNRLEAGQRVTLAEHEKERRMRIEREERLERVEKGKSKIKQAAKENTSVSPRPPKSVAPKRPRLTSEERAARDAEREARKAAKEAVREAEKAAREAAKEAEKAAKQAARDEAAAEKRHQAVFDSVNKAKKGKKDSIDEMIVDISSSFSDSSSDLGERIGEMVMEAGAAGTETWTAERSFWRLIKWRRRVKATFDEDQHIFVPLPDNREDIVPEPHLLVHLTAKDFANLAVSRGLDAHASDLRRIATKECPSPQPPRLIYLIEGLIAFTRKVESAKANQYQNSVRGVLNHASVTAPPSRAVQALPPISKELLETAQITLQVHHNVLIHHTTAPHDSAEWILNFTGDISTTPYRHARQILELSFCTETGQVKTGLTARDTFSKMLQEIRMVTPAMAEAIVAEYGCVAELARAIEREGEAALEGIRMGHTRTGAASEKTIGRILSRRIGSVFLETDLDKIIE